MNLKLEVVASGVPSSGLTDQQVLDGMAKLFPKAAPAQLQRFVARRPFVVTIVDGEESAQRIIARLAAAGVVAVYREPEIQLSPVEIVQDGSSRLGGQEHASPVSDSSPEPAKPEDDRRSKIIFWGGLFFILALALWRDLTAPEKPPDYEGAAQFFCHGLIRNKLSVPLSADFSYGSDVVTKVGETRYRIQGAVKAKNRLGVTLEAPFDCKFEYLGGDVDSHTSWRVTAATLIEP